MTYHDDAFRHGFIVLDRATTRVPEGWMSERIGTGWLYAHTSTSYLVRQEGPDRWVALLGQPVDSDAGTILIEQIVKTALERLKNGSIDDVVNYIAYLGGRFTAVVVDPGGMYVVPDCHATQSIYWTSRGGFAFATHAKLLAEISGLPFDERSIKLRRQLAQTRGGTHFMMGADTPYEGMLPLMPNCMLYSPKCGGEVQHRRFYPFQELRKTDDIEAAYRQFERRFNEHVRLLQGFGPVGVSLTSGLDSRTTFSAVRPDQGEVFSFTFFRYPNVSAKHLEDIVYANRLSWELDVKHKVVPIEQRWEPEGFDDAYRDTWERVFQARRIARALYRYLPRNFFQLQSTISETGTMFWKDRARAEFDASELVRVWQNGRTASLPDEGPYVESFQWYINYAGFTPGALMNLDFRDAFYWEHRNGRWAANRYHEADLGHRVLLPFNDRGLIETMLSVPDDVRESKAFLKEYIARSNGDKPSFVTW